MSLKTDSSRFHIHDELTAPDGAAALLKSIVATGGAISKFIGVISGSPVVLRAYTRMRGELLKGDLPEQTRLRIALAVAEHRSDTYSVAQHARRARLAGMGLDEISKARSWSSGDEREHALLVFLKETLVGDASPPVYLHEEARELGWEDEQILEALAHVGLNEFQSLFARAGALPSDQINSTTLPDAA